MTQEFLWIINLYKLSSHISYNKGDGCVNTHHYGQLKQIYPTNWDLATVPF